MASEARVEIGRSRGNLRDVNGVEWGMKRFTLVSLAIALVTFATVTVVVLRDGDPSDCRTTERHPDDSTNGICPDGTRFGGAPSGSAALAPKPEPTLTRAEFRSQKVGNRYRVWPRSEDVTNDGTYRFTAPHCGIEWMTDFDGSFWKIVDRKSYGKNRPSFFINGDRGTLTFEDDISIVYRASTGKEVRLRRLPGPRVIDLCD